MLPVFQLMQSMAHYIRQTFSLHVQLVAEVKWIQHEWRHQLQEIFSKGAAWSVYKD